MNFSGQGKIEELLQRRRVFETGEFHAELKRSLLQFSVDGAIGCHRGPEEIISLGGEIFFDFQCAREDLNGFGSVLANIL